MAKSKPNVLVVLASGKMGYGICRAFLDSGGYNVYGTSRDPQNSKLCSAGIIPIEFQFGDQESMENALHISNADIAILVTDFISIAQSNTETELRHARVMIDACKNLCTNHVILCSNHCAEVSPEVCKARNMTNKLALEKYLKVSGIESYSILRPTSFFENYDEPKTYNPLTRGYLSDMYPHDAKVSFVATYDIGRAAVAMASSPQKWRGKYLDCVSCVSTGAENTQILSSISNVPCTYKVAPPSPILWLISSDLYYMVRYVADGSPGIDPAQSIKEFREVVPDAMGMREWLIAKGKWSDGTKFGEALPKPEGSPVSQKIALSLALIVAVAAIGYAAKLY